MPCVLSYRLLCLQPPWPARCSPCRPMPAPARLSRPTATTAIRAHSDRRAKPFHQAVNVVDAGGEVTAIDSAGFGPISITKAVAITSPNGVEAGIVPAAGDPAIIVKTFVATTVVALRGLTLEGQGTASDGVQVTGT